MSRRLVYEAAVSMHPLLVADPIARDVLCRMADRAQDRNGGRIIESVETIADMCGRPTAVVRRAQKRLLSAGLIQDHGRGDYNARVVVFTIAEDVLIDLPRLEIGDGEGDSTKRNDSVSGMLTDTRTVTQPCADRDAIVTRSCSDRDAIVLPTRARALNGEPEREQENTKEKCGPAPPPPALVSDDEPEWLRGMPPPPEGEPDHEPEGEEQLASRTPPLAVITPGPKVSPGEERVKVAIALALEAIGTGGVPERTLKLWRAKLSSRLRDDGVGEAAVAARLEAIKAAWVNLQRSAWHVEHGRATREHLFKVTLRSGQELDAMAKKRAAGPPAAASRWSKGGQHYGRPEDAFDSEVPF